MNNLHFTRWSDQLRESDHEVFWFDIKDQGYSPSMSWMTQVVGWKKGFLKKKGRSFIKKRVPKFFSFLSSQLDVPVEKAFEKALLDIQPDVVHSFALYISCTPIYEVMKKCKEVNWLYSSWGSDLYYFQHDTAYLKDIQKVLLRMDFLITDCHRDHQIASQHGFKGNFLGVIPGGGGFELDSLQNKIQAVSKRKIILVKGNQNRSGRALPVLKALVALPELLCDYEIVVFGAQDPKIFEFQKEKDLTIRVHGLLDHSQILELMCASLIYIGNSNSDGMPNTLLEAMCCGAFPIQSNPGNATAEIVTHASNGLLIEDCENSEEIKGHVIYAINQPELIKEAYIYNQSYAKEYLSRDKVAKKALEMYQSIEP